MCSGCVTEAKIWVKYYPCIYYRTGSHGCGTLRILLHRIIYTSISASLTKANADNNFIVRNDLVYINNALVQVKSNMTLKYHNQYFSFSVIHFNSRPNQLICGLPIDLVVLRRPASLYNLNMAMMYCSRVYMRIDEKEENVQVRRHWP